MESKLDEEVKIEAREENAAKERRSAILHFYNVKQLLSGVLLLFCFFFVIPDTV